MKPKTNSTRNRGRRGQVLVMAVAALAPLLLVILAMVADIGQVVVTKAELQNTADAATLAAGHVLHTSRLDGNDEATARAAAEAEAQLLIADNGMSGAEITIEFGERDENGNFVALSSDEAASVVQCTLSRNDNAADGRVELFFSPMLGHDDVAASGSAVCEVFSRVTAVRGDLTPFAVPEWKVDVPGTIISFYPAGEDDEQNGNSNGNGKSKKDKNDADNGNGDDENGAESGGTGDLQTTSGNWGLLDFDGGSNSNQDVASWIRYGYQGTIALNDEGYIIIDGTPGFRASNENDLVWRIENDPYCTVLVYTEVSGNGANSEYKCVGFLNVELLSANLNGKPSSRSVTARIMDFETITDADVSNDVGYESPNLGKLMLVK